MPCRTRGTACDVVQPGHGPWTGTLPTAVRKRRSGFPPRVFWRSAMFRKKSLLPFRSSRPRPSRPHLEELESRITPYAISGNAWTHPELISLSFAASGTIWAAGKASNLFSSFNGTFYSTAEWQHQILLAAQSRAEQANLNFTVL